MEIERQTKLTEHFKARRDRAREKRPEYGRGKLADFLLELGMEAEDVQKADVESIASEALQRHEIQIPRDRASAKAHLQLCNPKDMHTALVAAGFDEEQLQSENLVEQLTKTITKGKTPQQEEMIPAGAIVKAMAAAVGGATRDPAIQIATFTGRETTPKVIRWLEDTKAAIDINKWEWPEARQRILLAFDDAARRWARDMQDDPTADWNDLEKRVRDRYVTANYADRLRDQLERNEHRLKHGEKVKDFKERIEEIADQIDGVREEDKLRWFRNGLPDEIRAMAMSHGGYKAKYAELVP